MFHGFRFRFQGNAAVVPCGPFSWRGVMPSSQLQPISSAVDAIVCPIFPSNVTAVPPSSWGGCNKILTSGSKIAKFLWSSDWYPDYRSGEGTEGAISSNWKTRLSWSPCSSCLYRELLHFLTKWMTCLHLRISIVMVQTGHKCCGKVCFHWYC